MRRWSLLTADVCRVFPSLTLSALTNHIHLWLFHRTLNTFKHADLYSSTNSNQRLSVYLSLSTYSQIFVGFIIFMSLMFPPPTTGYVFCLPLSARLYVSNISVILSMHNYFFINMVLLIMDQNFLSTTGNRVWWLCLCVEFPTRSIVADSAVRRCNNFLKRVISSIFALPFLPCSIVLSSRPVFFFCRNP